MSPLNSASRALQREVWESASPGQKSSAIIFVLDDVYDMKKVDFCLMFLLMTHDVRTEDTPLDDVWLISIFRRTHGVHQK